MPGAGHTLLSAAVPWFGGRGGSKGGGEGNVAAEAALPSPIYRPADSAIFSPRSAAHQSSPEPRDDSRYVADEDSTEPESDYIPEHLLADGEDQVFHEATLPPD